MIFKVRKEILGLDEDESVSHSPRHGTSQVPSNARMPEGKNLLNMAGMSDPYSGHIFHKIIFVANGQNLRYV